MSKRFRILKIQTLKGERAMTPLLMIADVNNIVSTTTYPITSTVQQAYKQALENLKNHIDDLANPCLVEDILQMLDQISKKPISLVDGIWGSFSNLILPEQTQRLLQALNAEICSLGANDPSQLQVFCEIIKKDICQLVNNQRTSDFPLWKELETLFKLPQIKALGNDQIKKMLNLIHEDNTESLRDYVLNRLSKYGVDEGKLNSSLNVSATQSPSFSYGVKERIFAHFTIAS
jgi:hypothetical protein